MTSSYQLSTLDNFKRQKRGNEDSCKSSEKFCVAGAIASGAIPSGAIPSGAIASGAIASGAIASGATKRDSDSGIHHATKKGPGAAKLIWHPECGYIPMIN